MNDLAGTPVMDHRAWRGVDFPTETDWVTPVSPAQAISLYELADALPADSADWFLPEALPALSGSLERLLTDGAKELASGRGFLLLRGLSAIDPERLRRAFWIIGNALGLPVMQNARGEVLSIVSDRFAGAPRGVDTRGYESNDELRYHCDGGDCIGMSCVRQAPEGGTNGLVSLFAIYNEILANHPEYLEVLRVGYPLYARKEQGDTKSTMNLGKVQQKRIPVFAWHESRLHETRMSAWLNIKLAEIAADVAGAGLSERERAALACVETIAQRPEMQLVFKQQPGDVLFINNMAVMHRRDRYIDAQDAEKKRVLYRMWINLHDAPSVVAGHAALRKGIRGPNPVIAAA